MKLKPGWQRSRTSTKLLDQKDSSKPSLRRTSNTSDTSNDKNDDDRPTLKRRDDSN